MPWAPSDAERHTKAASTAQLRELWARVANDELARHGDEARAIRAADAAVKRASERPRHRYV